MNISVPLYYLATVNLLAFAGFWVDKKAAITGDWPIPEANLLLWSFWGGWLSARKCATSVSAQDMEATLRLNVEHHSTNMDCWSDTVDAAASLFALVRRFFETNNKKQTPRFFRNAGH